MYRAVRAVDGETEEGGGMTDLLLSLLAVALLVIGAVGIGIWRQR
jgi:hypothetical protein